MDSTLNEQFTFSSTSGTFLNSPVNSLTGDLTLGLIGLSGSFTAWGDAVIANSFSFQDISTGNDPFSLTGAFSDYMDFQLDFSTDFYYSGFDF